MPGTTVFSLTARCLAIAARVYAPLGLAKPSPSLSSLAAGMIENYPDPSVLTISTSEFLPAFDEATISLVLLLLFSDMLII